MAETRKTRSSKKAPERDWRPDFLTALAAGGHVLQAAKVAGVSRATVYRQRVSDEDFAVAWADAIEESIETLEREMLRRAAEGVEEPVFYMGKQIATVRKFSDTLLIFALKSKRPEIYRDNHQPDVGGHPPVVPILEGHDPTEIDPEKRREAARALLDGLDDVPRGTDE
jgi:hypothetical protein